MMGLSQLDSFLTLEGIQLELPSHLLALKGT